MYLCIKQVQTHIRQLRPLHALSRLDVKVALVAAQRTDAQLVEIGELVQVRVRLVAIILAVLAPPLRPHRLDAVLVVIANVNMLGTWVAT